MIEVENIENDSEKKLEKKKKLNQKKKKQRLERKKRQQEDVEDQKLLDLISQYDNNMGITDVEYLL